MAKKRQGKPTTPMWVVWMFVGFGGLLLAIAFLQTSTDEGYEGDAYYDGGHYERLAVEDPPRPEPRVETIRETQEVEPPPEILPSPPPAPQPTVPSPVPQKDVDLEPPRYVSGGIVKTPTKIKGGTPPKPPYAPPKAGNIFSWLRCGPAQIRVRGTFPHRPQLLFMVEIRNDGQDTPIHYRTWSEGRGATLTGVNNRVYKPLKPHMPGKSRAQRTLEATIKPDEGKLDTLAFEIPVDMSGEYIYLDLPAENLGGMKGRGARVKISRYAATWNK